MKSAIETRREKDLLRYVWRAMKQRCGHLSCQNETTSRNYRDRGIRVCEQWVNDLPAFREWAFSNGYAQGLCIDRRDNNGSYSPDNCRWVTRTENNRNRRTTLTPGELDRIRDLYRMGIGYHRQAKWLGIKPGNIYGVTKGRTFCDVP